MLAAMHHTRLATFLLGSLLVVACGGKKDDKKDPGGGGGGAPAVGKDGDKPPEGGTAAAPADNADLGRLPADAELIAGIELAQIIGSPLWKAVGPKLLASAGSDLDKLKALCGFDPLTTIKRVTVGLKNLGDMPDGIVVVHGLDKAKTLACLDKAVAEASADDRPELIKDGDVTIARGKDKGEALGVTFAADNAAVIALGAAATKDGLLAAAKGGAGPTSSPAFTDLYAKVNTKDAVWLLVNGSAKVLDGLSDLGIKPKVVFGSIGVADGVTADVRVRVDSADQATQVAQGLNSQAQAVAGMVDKVAVTAEASDIRLTGAASTAKLQALLKMFGDDGGGAEPAGQGW